jgi:hypothetical protein
MNLLQNKKNRTSFLRGISSKIWEGKIIKIGRRINATHRKTTSCFCGAIRIEKQLCRGQPKEPFTQFDSNWPSGFREAD